MKYSLFVLLAVSIILLPTQASAEPASETVITSVTTDQIVAILDGAGYRAEIVEGQRPLVRARISGQTVMIPLYDCKEGRCSSFQFHLSLAKPEKITSEWIERFNANMRFVKAYFSKQGNVAFEFDVPLSGGVTRNYISSKADFFGDFIAWYEKTVSGEAENQSKVVTFDGVAFPPSIADARRARIRDHGPALGHSVEYLAENQFATVYIYDLELPNIPDDLQAPIVRTQLDKSKEDIKRVGRYVKVDFKRDFTVDDARDRKRLLCSELEVVDKRDLVPRDSLVCLGVVKNKFIKFRVTGTQKANSLASARAFVGEWVKLLWPPN